MSMHHDMRVSMPCGCRFGGGESTEETQGIVFCSLHSAAPRLLTALEELLPWMERGKERFDREQARVLTQALAAIREAKGGS